MSVKLSAISRFDITWFTRSAGRRPASRSRAEFVDEDGGKVLELMRISSASCHSGCATFLFLNSTPYSVNAGPPPARHRSDLGGAQV